MSALQRVEETYLSILRFVIIAVSSILLVVSVVVGLMAISNMKGSSEKEQPVASINPDEVINKVAAGLEKPAEAKATKADKYNLELNTDPNHKYYQRTADAIVKFVEKTAKDFITVAPEKVISIVKSEAERYEDDLITMSSFASGLAETMEKGLANPAILKRVEKSPVAIPVQSNVTEEEEQPYAKPSMEAPFKENPLEIVDELLRNYAQMFANIEKAKEEAKNRALAEEMERKANASQQLYIAGGTFLSFLLLVFISIVVKIERNLRGAVVTPKSS